MDFSKRSLEYAIEFSENNGLSINYVHQNYLNFNSHEKFDLITMIMCDFCALSPEQRYRMLDIFKRHLENDGHVMIDVYSLHAYSQREEVAIYERNLLNGFWSEEDYFGFLNTYKYDVEKVILDKYTIIKPSGQGLVYNWLQYFSIESVTKEFNQAGFEVQQIKGDFYGGEYSEASDEFALIAVRS